MDGTPALISLWYYEDAQRKSDIWERWLDRGWPLLLDSGFFSLYERMLRRDGLSRDQAPATMYVLEDDPEYDRMSAIWDKVYSDRSVVDRCWGLIEVDAGEWRVKRQRREMMEDRYGIAFIPVFHLGSDPWAYLDFLLAGYDRIAASFIYVPKGGRDGMMLELFDRLDGSDVWIHMLAWSPDQCRTFIPHSMDSTTWGRPFRGMTPPPGTLWSDRTLTGLSDGFRARRGTQDYRRMVDLSLDSALCQDRSLRRFDAQRSALDGWLVR